MASIRFRDDINGLRALAVTAVVLFHFKLSFVPGGFAGVDVFFVISGYLMTLIITRRLEKGSFSLIGFYGDRARRIVPPLYTMIFSLFVFGYVFIDPYSYQKLGSTGISALLFFSNFRFWEATGYFDAKSATKWLLHTWSLSVEWQFYLLYPIILMGLTRFLKAQIWRLAVLWLLAILSLLASIDWSATHPASTFYLLPFRAWEMLAGGLVALQFDSAPQDKRVSYLLLVSGLALIAFAFLTFDEHQAWPSYLAAIPVFGTCLVIVARQTGSALFANPVTRFLGEWSYAIYLWHWPVAVATHYFDFQGFESFRVAGHVFILAAVIALVIILAAKARKWLATDTRPAFSWAAGASLTILTVMFAILIASSDGLPGRIKGGEQMFEAFNQAAGDWTYPGNCVGPGLDGNPRPCHAGENTADTLFIGDSFAMQLYPRFAGAAALKEGRSFTFVTDAGCPALLGINHGLVECSAFMEKAFDFAEKGNYRRVVLVSNWYEYFATPNGAFCFLENGSCVVNLDPSWYAAHLDSVFARTAGRLAALKKHGAELFIISSTPFSQFDVPIELAKRNFFGSKTDDVEFIDRDAFERAGAPVRKRLNAMAKASGAVLIDPLPFLCDAHRCPTIGPQGVSLFVDAIHYRSAAVRSPRFQFLDEATGLGAP